MNISYKRVALCYFLIVTLLFVCSLRILSISDEEKYKQAAEQTSRRVITLDFSRGTIFDANMNRITNEKEIYYAVILDESLAAGALYDNFSSEEINKIVQEIRQNKYSLRKVPKEIVSDGVYCFRGYAYADDSLIAKHIIGYTDYEGRGVCGLEAAFDDLLYSANKNSITFTIDGQGKVIDGYQPQLNFNYNMQNNGVKITIDKNIQQIAEQQAMNINCGAVVVTEISTGKIKAMVSRPDYKLSNLGAALEDEKEPMLNRALCTYNIGSVFKPMVAAVGYEDKASLTIDCTGYTNVDGLTFACHKIGGHGTVSLSEAIKFSCNSYFYNYIQQISVEKLFSMAKKVGFDSKTYLADGIYGAKGNLSSTDSAQLTKRQLANISIGQGELMASPITITNLYIAIANDGVYIPPSLVEGKIENGKLIVQNASLKGIRLFSKTTADKLKRDLATVLDEDGTGKAAKPALVTAAGKTGTAQTGVVKGGTKVTNSWFCGFFPLENPKYAVTILSENAKGGCGGVFAEIADAITQYETDSVD